MNLEKDAKIMKDQKAEAAVDEYDLKVEVEAVVDVTDLKVEAEAVADVNDLKVEVEAVADVKAVADVNHLKVEVKDQKAEVAVVVKHLPVEVEAEDYQMDKVEVDENDQEVEGVPTEDFYPEEVEDEVEAAVLPQLVLDEIPKVEAEAVVDELKVEAEAVVDVTDLKAEAEAVVDVTDLKVEAEAVVDVNDLKVEAEAVADVTGMKAEVEAGADVKDLEVEVVLPRLLYSMLVQMRKLKPIELPKSQIRKNSLKQLSDPCLKIILKLKLLKLQLLKFTMLTLKMIKLMMIQLMILIMTNQPIAVTQRVLIARIPETIWELIVYTEITVNAPPVLFALKVEIQENVLKDLLKFVLQNLMIQNHQLGMNLMTMKKKRKKKRWKCGTMLMKSNMLTLIVD